YFFFWGGGGAFMLLFGLFITKKLIQPLMKLQQELKKVKERHFSDVKLIKAGGEIGAVAKSVYDMAGELNRFNHVQKQFFQNASHELKTPLMSISGYAEGIKDGIFEGEGIDKGLDIIMSESSRLKNLVTEMTLLA
ncbi:MAG TPA: sensor histidine kinase, partial [Paenibacillus sp.]|nr:sensor histidine kinase [Paenibacillus sp.]